MRVPTMVFKVVPLFMDKRRAKRYFATTGRKSPAAEMDALEARMKARREEATEGSG